MYLKNKFRNPVRLSLQLDLEVDFARTQKSSTLSQPQ